jgi:hypothetical protein
VITRPGPYADPDAEAARLQDETRGWSVWYGHATRRFWAMRKPPAPEAFVSAASTGELVQKMSWHGG